MGLKLVVCCDGTWNVPRTGTNIYRTYDFLKKLLRDRTETADPPRGTQESRGTSPRGDDVVLFYDEGVGADPDKRLIEGFSGGGLSENIIDAYEFLARNYRPGAEIYVFGFSRGAYTARSLCGFIKAAGLLRGADRNRIVSAYFRKYALPALYGKAEYGGKSRLERFGSKLRGLVPGLGDHPEQYPDVKIRFVGVYDTVGALGVPLSHKVIDKLEDPFVGFHDMSLIEIIEHAVHALAADERRAPYAPSLWAAPKNTKLREGQTLLQVWFPGVHSDIGGGYTDKGIGNHTWTFMMDEAANRGLVLDDAQRIPSVQLDPLPSQHDSFDPRWLEIAAKLDLEAKAAVPRMIDLTTADLKGTKLDVLGDVRIHWTLFERIGKTVKVIGDKGTADLQYLAENLLRDAGNNPVVRTLERAVAAAAAGNDPKV